MGSSKKRKRSNLSKDPSLQQRTDPRQSGVAATLPIDKGSLAQDQQQENHDAAHEAAEDENDADGWTVVGRSGKKRKTNNYPALVYADSYKQQSSIKLGELQSLVLYCLANGTSPQWTAVRHHSQVNKAVVLFVPGLERGMFDGSVALDASSEGPAQEPKLRHGLDQPQNGETSHSVPSRIDGAQNDGVSRTHASPDDYLPVRLAAENLPQPLKLLADCFEYLLPVKAPGDDRFSRVYSPLHHMLNSQIPKSRDPKADENVKNVIKGEKPANDQRSESKRTPITDFILSMDQLRENDFVVHPAWYDTESEEQAEMKRRVDASQDAASGWVDSQVASLGAGDDLKLSSEQGSLTAGWTVLAMDCEMCTVQGGEAALTRISLIDWDGEVIMDGLVKPDKPIIDYLTR